MVKNIIRLGLVEWETADRVLVAVEFLCWKRFRYQSLHYNDVAPLCLMDVMSDLVLIYRKCNGTVIINMYFIISKCIILFLILIWVRVLDWVLFFRVKWEIGFSLSPIFIIIILFKCILILFWNFSFILCILLLHLVY